MFNIAFPELVVILLVALIVIGPDKLPKVAHTLGLMVGRMQRFMSAVKNDLDQELKNNDLLRLQEELKHQQEGLNEELRRGMKPVADVIRRSEAEVAETIQTTSIQPVYTKAKQPTATIKSEGATYE
ncbi:Sec-independent protein translocase protein TatB [Methylophaga sp. OBS3]|uniref:Sec-independent protein translocase protein TatB n=1 Tax=Methylophaga sp. OBS3 TaxID=2991934 RepID=UPI002259E169|nr:Sec-independent protein translocase protein TatB [Methylophaga sp. OBS3]MCX4190513.1 Sec-independent protein translocase protein TatB [Methylophaga sp. OBS3]